MYFKEEERKKTASGKIKKSMEQTIKGKRRAPFNYKTCAILKDTFCCRAIATRASLK